jgi:signal transduction histidine kinase
VRGVRPGTVPLVTDATSTLHALSQAVLAVSRRRPVDEVLHGIVEAARELIGAEYAALGVPDEADSFSRFVVAGVTDDQWRAIGPLPRRHGILGVMLRQARPERLADIRTDPRFRGWPGAHPEMADFLGMPILDGPTVLGALYLANKRPGAGGGRSGTGGGFTRADEELLEVLAGHAAIALTNAALYERERERTVVEERQRLARELHDAVAQKLFSLRLTVGAAAELLERDPVRARAELAEVQQLSAEALAELRAAIFQLRPAELSEDGLADTLRKHVEVLRRVHGVRIDWACDEPEAQPVPPLSPEAEDAVFRVAQEALHNALRHAEAAVIGVALRGEGCMAVLEVRDDGVGFDVRALRLGGRRLGLSSMRARALGAGGTFALTSEPGRGTTVRMEVPGAC